MTAYSYYLPSLLPQEERIPCFAFDVDGTLALGGHRVHHIRREKGDERPKDWPAYFAGLDHDEPNTPVVEVCRLLGKRWPIIYLTARPGDLDYIPRTAKWLQRQELSLLDPIFHRPGGDYRQDHEIKLELLKEAEALGYAPLMIFDDRKRVVDAVRNAGYQVAQVAPGDF